MATGMNLYSLITAIFVGGAAGYLGSLMLTKRMALVGDALGHVALPGMGLALLFGFNVSLGAFVFLLAGILLIWFLEAKTELSAEALVGIIFVLSLAIGFLITPEPELLHALVGDISEVSFWGAFTAAVFCIVLFLLVKKIYSRLMIISLSQDLAKAEKINANKLNLFYLLAIAVIVALGVKVVGSLLVGALVIVPAAAARNLSKNLKQYVSLSALLGMISCFLGIVLSGFVNLPAGPLVIIISVALFGLSLFKRYEKIFGRHILRPFSPI
jgi:ABC-type Mn2+/Zn2+ transport system permease subunit